MTLSSCLSIFLVADIDPVLTNLVLLSIGILAVGLLLKSLKQPYIIAYILAGVFMGPSGMGIVTDESLITLLGSFGLILLLFFIGMEISLPQLIANWKVSVLGTLLQVAFSIGAIWIIGAMFDWPFHRIILLGFVISLSSTAVVIKLLQERGEINTRVGQNVIGILIAQDVLIVPMLLTLNYLTGASPAPMDIFKQVIGACFLIGMVVWVLRKKQINIPFQDKIRSDHEIQVFLALVICFGFSVISAFFGLSAALGAFVAGILVSSAKAAEWIHDSLHAFRVLFVAMFFVSVGMLINLEFVSNNISIVLLLVAMVFLTNNLINAFSLKIFGETWRDSLYAGAILAQIGEFSFILGATAYNMELVTEFTYQLILSVISISLVISPFWILLIRALLFRKKTLN